jgi:heme A synthase
MSRYFYTAYMANPSARLAPVAAHLMFDGMTFMTLAVLFFVMCRSLSPSHWLRFYTFLLALLAVDTVWIIVSMIFGAKIIAWLILNVILAVLLLATLVTFWPDRPYDEHNLPPRAPGWLCAFFTFNTTLLSYLWMLDFYFP